MKNILFLLSVITIISCAEKSSVLRIDNDLEENPTIDQETVNDGPTSPSGVDSEILDDDGLPILTFEAQKPQISNGPEYTIDVNEWDIPNNGSNAIKTTANLQAAIDWAHDEGFTQVLLPLSLIHI